jgi:hypothetical protein
MPANTLESELRVRARESISQGRLPCQHAVRMWAGYGTGQQPCSLCDTVITRDEVEYEVEHPGSERPQVSRFHVLCHAAWQLECAREESLRKQSP